MPTLPGEAKSDRERVSSTNLPHASREGGIVMLSLATHRTIQERCEKKNRTVFYHGGVLSVRSSSAAGDALPPLRPDGTYARRMGIRLHDSDVLSIFLRHLCVQRTADRSLDSATKDL